MVNARASARTGKGVEASVAAAAAADSGVGPEHKREASASRLLVWKWWLEVFKALLRLRGYSEWVVEGLGDCQLIAFAAGHEMKEKKTVEKLTTMQRSLLVTKGMRKPAVALLLTGKVDGFEATLSEAHIAMIAAMKHLHTSSVRATNAAMKQKMAPWLEPQHYGKGGYSMLAALGILNNRVCHGSY
jgi:hypothetical protein